ncbi:MAG: antitoxin family protein [Caldilineaceae bacterium]
MVNTFPVVYEHGVLRPLKPVNLPESSPLQVQVIDDTFDDQTLSYRQVLVDLRRFAALAEQNWSNSLVQEVFAQRIEPDVRKLWRLADATVRDLCGMLVLASAQVQPETVTVMQVQAFLFGLNLLETAWLNQKPLTDAELDQCFDQLTLAGLPPAISLSDSTVQSYVDEL